jgi:hypothetical protein
VVHTKRRLVRNVQGCLRAAVDAPPPEDVTAAEDAFAVEKQGGDMGDTVGLLVCIACVHRPA